MIARQAWCVATWVQSCARRSWSAKSTEVQLPHRAVACLPPNEVECFVGTYEILMHASGAQFLSGTKSSSDEDSENYDDGDDDVDYDDEGGDDREEEKEEEEKEDSNMTDGVEVNGKV
ncbi:unnamed protein product [Gongylonema pulchrum]|uniref:NPL domain-containing protein n=1 Tax=Gongylonema pulchrum TaxID=637853 RepID=A0A183DAB2_9BILA|nr:unnamed protein product [Gongylonema pulchrum]